MRILHTMIRVGDLDRAIAFYTEVLGMRLLRRTDYPEGRFTLAFVGYGPEDAEAVLELTHNWDTPAYDLGNGWGITGHVGHQKVENSVTVGTLKDASYSDWKVGVTKDVGFGVVGLSYSATDVNGSCNSSTGSTVNPYCWGKLQSLTAGVPTYAHFKNVADDRVVLSFTKTF